MTMGSIEWGNEKLTRRIVRIALAIEERQNLLRMITYFSKYSLNENWKAFSPRTAQFNLPVWLSGPAASHLQVIAARPLMASRYSHRTHQRCLYLGIPHYQFKIRI